ncbi:MAG: amino acid adenylation domain-containing protein, partial [Sedimenticolaceae bacterium]
MLVDEDGHLVLECDFDAEVINAKTVDRLLDHLHTLLVGLVFHEDLPIAELPMLSDDEEQQQLQQWNDTAVAYPPTATLQQLFEQQVARSPQAPALTFADTTWSYQELDARANGLARRLQTAGVDRGTLVGVLMERSLEMVLALYAIIKAGGAYVPLDPDYPADRLAAMLEDAKVKVILTQSALRGRLTEDPETVIQLDELALQAVDMDRAGIEPRATATDLAYVIFTSGSTGRPKGVMIEHRSICNRLLWMQDQYGLTPGDVVLQKTPFSFDVSVWEFFWPLLSGARLVIAEPCGHRDSAYLVDVIQREAVTTLHFVPSMLQLFVEQSGVEQCHTLKRVICSGEALPFKLQHRFFERIDAELHNLYGPTEAAIDVSYWECRPDGGSGSVPIGFPVANTQLYVLDTHKRPVPTGVPGELFIGGVQLARGYVGRDDLTAERFVPDPFNIKPGSRLYSTGDLVRRLPDGCIDFIGRIDHQVKLRGFRIELGEIEAVLLQHSGIRQCAVIVYGTSAEDQRLAAYCVSDDGDAPSRSELLSLMRMKLPEFMVPAHITFLSALPLTANGKLDRKGLPDPARLTGDGTPSLLESVNNVVDKIIGIWRDVLGIDSVGLDNNFFDLGGHSLLLAQVRKQLEEAFDASLSMTELFQYPTVR